LPNIIPGQFFDAQFRRAKLTAFRDTFSKLKTDFLGDMTLQIFVDVYDIHKIQKEYEGRKERMCQGHC